MQYAGFLRLTQNALNTHQAYLHSIKASRSQQTDKPNGDRMLGRPGSNNNNSHSESHPEMSEEATTSKRNVAAMAELFGKIRTELGFAKREVAYGHLDSMQLKDIYKLLRNIFLPVFGLTTFVDIVDSVKQHKQAEWSAMESEETIKAIRELQTDEWDEIMTVSRGPSEKLNEALQEALRHILFTLGFQSQPKTPPNDEESGPRPAVSPGHPDFAQTLERRISEFRSHREITLKSWCDRKGLKVPSNLWDDPARKVTIKDIGSSQDGVRIRHNQQMLYLILYVEYLMFSVSQNVLMMVKWADDRVADGTMKKKRFILPGFKRMQKWIMNLFSVEDIDGDQAIDTAASVYIGDSLKARKDPEHLDPANWYERWTDPLRTIPRILGSPASTFGFRAACATMSLGVLAFLEQTQIFFIRQRVLWALIMIAISMGAHAGQGIYGFLSRLFGTVIAMVFSIGVWYIVDHQPAAVLPVLYISLFFGFYVLVKFPRFIIVAILSTVSTILMVGYELQVQQVGVQIATSNGQPYYPIYELAPYRLAAVASGLFVAFIFTYFPYPVTTHATLRKDLGATLFLLANFYSCVHTTVNIRLHLGLRDAEDDSSTPGGRLARARNKVLSKTLVLLDKLRESSRFSRFEPTFGGQFPRSTYDDLIQSMQNMFNYMALISYATRTFVAAESSDDTTEETDWLISFRRFASDLDLTTQEITSTLALLSSSVTNAQPLPPYLRHPRPYNLGEKLERAAPDLLSVSHVSEPCYAAFAVLQVASSLVQEELEKSVKLVRRLVGEVDFSFHVISTSSEKGSTVSLLRESRKGKGD